MEGKGKYTGIWKNEVKIRLEYSDETFILRWNFFSKCSKNFSIGLMIMFKVCRRCLQRCFLRWKKNYERMIHSSKYIQKKLTPPNHPQERSTASTQQFTKIWSVVFFSFQKIKVSFRKATNTTGFIMINGYVTYASR